MWPLVLILMLLGGEPADAEAPPVVSLQTIDGRQLDGALVALDRQQVQLRHDDQNEQIPVAQLLAASPIERPAGTRSAPAAMAVVVRLVDGSQLGGAEVTSAQDGLQLKRDGDSQVQIPLSAVAWMRFPAASPDIGADWERILALDAGADVLVVRKENSLDYHEGIVRGVRPDVVEFELDGEVLPVKRAKIEGIRYFNRAGRQLPDAVCRVVCSGGTQLAAADWTLHGSQLAVKTPAGLEIELPWKTIERLDFSQGKIVYLSDLDWDPQLYEREAYFGGRQPIDEGLDLYPPQRDQALDGGPLQLDARPFAKGLAIHSRTRLVYRLPGDYRRFMATAGIDDRTGSQGAVRLVIEGDGRELYAADIAGSDAAQPLDLDITGVKRLSILVDFGGDLDISDHLDLAEARIVK